MFPSNAPVLGTPCWASTFAVRSSTHWHVLLHCNCKEINVLPEGHTSYFSWQWCGVGACGTGRAQFRVQSVGFGARGYPRAELEVARRGLTHLCVGCTNPEGAYRNDFRPLLAQRGLFTPLSASSCSSGTCPRLVPLRPSAGQGRSRAGEEPRRAAHMVLPPPPPHPCISLSPPHACISFSPLLLYPGRLPRPLQPGDLAGLRERSGPGRAS